MFIEHDIALIDHDYGTSCVGDVCIMFQAQIMSPITLHPIYISQRV